MPSLAAILAAKNPKPANMKERVAVPPAVVRAAVPPENDRSDIFSLSPNLPTGLPVGGAGLPVGGVGGAGLPVGGVGGAGLPVGGVGGAGLPVGGAGISRPPGIPRPPKIPTVSTIPVDSSTKIIGKGGFGFILRPALPNTNASGSWQKFPDNVTKIFYNKSDYNKIKTTASNLPRIFGPNSGHRTNLYRHTYKLKNLPNDIRSKFTSVPPETPIFPIRMPYLGKSLDEITKPDFYNAIRKIPVQTVLGQILKLLQQVKNVKDHGYIHGDIRETNIMMNPTTGILTLIDFDHLKPFKDFLKTYPFGFYCHPPETLLLFHTLKKKSDYSMTFESYIKYLFSSFKHVFETRGIADEEELETLVNEALESLESVRSISQIELLETFDSFGLALSLLLMIAVVYPGCIFKGPLTSEKRELFKRGLSSRGICNAENLDQCVDALLEITYHVLFPLCELNSSERMKIDEAVPIASTIVSGAAPVAAAGGATGGGSAAATRRSRQRNGRRNYNSSRRR